MAGASAKRPPNDVPRVAVLLCAPSRLSRGAKHSPLELLPPKGSLRFCMVGGLFSALRRHRTPQPSRRMTRKSEHYHGKVRWPCGSLPHGPGFHEWQARAQNVLRMTFQGLPCTFQRLRGLAVVRSTLPWNFCLRRGPYAFVWSEACFEHFGATELHNKAPK